MLADRRPVIGEVIPWFAEIQNPFDAFDTGTMRGLAYVHETQAGLRIDVLAVNAAVPGRGDFRAFVTALKAAYRVVGFWEILNVDVAGMLTRYGFIETVEYVAGDVSPGMIWKAS